MSMGRTLDLLLFPIPTAYYAVYRFAWSNLGELDVDLRLPLRASSGSGWISRFVEAGRKYGKIYTIDISIIVEIKSDRI
jgi:hypothetical protein